MSHPNLEAIDDALGRARSPLIIAFLQYMRQIHPADRLPGRSAFDPMAIPHALGNLVLVDVQRPPQRPPRFLVRVAGEVVLLAAPTPMMNRYLDEVMLAHQARTGDDSDIMVSVRQTVLDTGRMYYWFGAPRMKFNFDYADIEYVHCPLADDGRTIDHIVSALYYHGALLN